MSEEYTFSAPEDPTSFEPATPERVWPTPVSFNNFDDEVSRTLFAITRDGLVLAMDIPRSDPGEKDALYVREDGVVCVSRGTR